MDITSQKDEISTQKYMQNFKSVLNTACS